MYGSRAQSRGPPARGGGAPQFGGIPPNQTLYIQSLNHKIKLPELQCCLYELFSTYGEVIDVVVGGSWAKKGQAFVVFRDISCSTNALRALQSFVFLDRPMRINYSRTKSDVVSLEDGTFKPRNQPDAGKTEGAGKDGKVKQQPAAAQRAKTPQTAQSPGGPGQSRGAAPKAGGPGPSSAPSAVAVPSVATGESQPSNVLFVENLPAEVNEMMLTMLFRQYPGFQEARLIKGRNVAFIEYADELQAGIAKHGLQGFMVTPEMSLKIAFAKQ